MFVRFKGFRDKLRQRGPHVDHELTLENSNLNANQIATALKALKILGLEPRQQALTKQDFIIFLYAMGLNPTEDIIDSKLRAFKLHHKKHYTFGQLAHVWYSMLQDLTDEDEILKRAFQFFDKDGNGEISVQELKTTMHELGDLLTEEEIAAFMAIMDVNNDGVIGYEEFLDTLKTQAPPLQGEGGARLQQQKLQQQKQKVDADKSVLARLGAQHYDQQPEHLPEHMPDHAGIASHASTSTRDNLAAAAAAALLHNHHGDGQPPPPPPAAAQRTGSSTRAGTSRLSHDSADAAASPPPASALLGLADGHRRWSRDGPDPEPSSARVQGSLRAGPSPPHMGAEEVQRPGEQPPTHHHHQHHHQQQQQQQQQLQGGEDNQAAGQHGGGMGALPGRGANGERPSPGLAGRLPPLGSSAGEQQGLPQPRKTDSYIADLGPGDPAGPAAGGGLRAPCVLEPGPGSDGSGSPAGRTGMTPPGSSRPASARRGP